MSFVPVLRPSFLYYTLKVKLFHPLWHTGFISTTKIEIKIDSEVLFTDAEVVNFLKDKSLTKIIPEDVFNELISTIEGAKGMLKPKAREIADESQVLSKGVLANNLENEISRFDLRQKYYMAIPEGVERIRGLAGSGKTVVLALKAALTHLKYPDARILYTFYTHSLYQHIQRMITRFYRQFDERDPDWSKLKIMHGWGGASAEGVYYNACIQNGTTPLSYSAASNANRLDPFDYACSKLLKEANIKPMFDYVFIDEGQDFPISFLKICVRLAEGNRMVYAYDELQTIFQKKAPAPADFLRPGAELADDVTLYKCYRNPREILVCAHALGFGIYGSKIVQMLENADYWSDVGYKVLQGNFVAGDETIIERPIENSLTSISKVLDPNDIVKCSVYGEFPEEIEAVVNNILQDIHDGLRPDDISIITVDDRNARNYLDSFTVVLQTHGIEVNNVFSDSVSLRTFQSDGRVTLSTVHRAKGNEAFMVYVVGVDALFPSPGVRERNMLFVAMTRAKGWVRVSGIGEAAQACMQEITYALDYFPNLQFIYPSDEQLKIMRRELSESAIRKLQKGRELEELLDQMSQDEINRVLKQRSTPKKKLD